MKTKSVKVTKTDAKSNSTVRPPLLADARKLILQTRAGVARIVDSALTTLYRHVGRRIRQDVLKNKRAGHVDEIVAALGRQLGWSHFKSLIPLRDRSIETIHQI